MSYYNKIEYYYMNIISLLYVNSTSTFISTFTFTLTLIMVYSTIFLIHGFVATKEELLKAGALVEYQDASDESDEEESNNNRSYIGVVKDKFRNDIKTWEYPCCSELGGKVFIVGKKIDTIYRKYTSCFNLIKERDSGLPLEKCSKTPYHLLKDACNQYDIPLDTEDQINQLSNIKKRNYMREKWIKIKIDNIINSPSTQTNPTINAFDICGPYHVCNECLGTTNNGTYDVDKILNSVVECPNEHICHYCKNDNRCVYEECKRCGSAPLKLTPGQKDHRDEYNLINPSELCIARNKVDSTKQIKYYYMLDDCLSCT